MEHGSFLETVRFRMRSWVGYRPIIFMMVVGRIRGRSGLICDSTTDIVIEGFPRSANTYAVACLRHWGKNTYKIASHQHAVAQLSIAKKNKVPGIVIVRSPMDAVISLKLRRPKVSINALIKEYCDFNEKLLFFKSSVVIANFETVIQDFSKVISVVNSRFGTRFESEKIDSKAAGFIEKIVDQMDMGDKLQSGERYGSTGTHIAKPIPGRELSIHLDSYRKQIAASQYFQKANRIFLELSRNFDV